MRIQVVYLGLLKELAGTGREELTLADGACAADVWRNLCERFPKMAGYSRSVAIAVNHEYAAPETLLKEGDEVALLPPVSGGAPAPELPLGSKHCRIQTEPIDIVSLRAKLSAGEDGAAVVFDGVVRNNTRGCRTLYLNYEAYLPMALHKLEELAMRALSEYKIRDVSIVHRLGRLEIGESSVVIVVASAHRGAAFDACRFVIDTMKKTVPIFKQEFFEDGAVWADGEPFPDSVPKIG